MRFYKDGFIEIEKDEASTTVLGIYHNGHFTGQFVNYHGAAIAGLKRLGATSVKLYTNHHGSDACTLSHQHHHATAKKVDKINRELSE